MKVICPKCQFENHADSSRVVCARCATIIEVRMDQGAGFDSNGKRQTARLPFASNSSSNNNQPLSSQPFSQNQDVYATRIGDDFDDVLDVPAQGQSGYQAAGYQAPNDAPPAFEDVFSTQSQDQNSVYDFASYGNGSETFRPDAQQRQTRDYPDPMEQEFMGWPVLPDEEMVDDDEVVESSRKGLFVRVGLMVGVFGVLTFLAYYFLGDYFLNKGNKKPGEVASAKSQNGNQPANNSAPNTAPSPASSPAAPTDSGSAQPPVVTPKPQDSAQGQTSKSQVVPIPPATNPPVTGPSGPSEPPKSLPAPSNSAKLPPPPSNGNLTIQVGSFKNPGDADARANGLKSLVGGDVRVVKADIPRLGTYYRVQLGGFGAREAALSYANQLRAKNAIADFIVTSK